MSRLVAVSNRVSVPRRGTAPGGLAVGVLAAMQVRGGLWFGWSGHVGPRESEMPEIVTRNGISFATLDLEEPEFSRYVNGFSNGALWPTFHYFLETVHFSDEDYAAYVEVNRLFARSLSPLLEPDDLIWVHDFHLIPLARMLRDQGATQAIAFFLHVPFPHVEALRVLPVYGELVNMMLTYDVLGFQTQSDVESFRSAVLHLHGPDALLPDGSVRAGERRVLIDAYPIGVDVDVVQRESRESQGSDEVKRMISGLLGRKVMIGVDRLDYSKGLVNRFHAYDRFLETHPDNLGHITYLQIAPLSRSDLRAYARIRRELEQTAGRINGRFAETDWTPIRYLNRNFAHDVLMGFFRVGPGGHRHAGARRHEPGRQGIRCGPGSGGSGRPDPLFAGRRSTRALRRAAGESARHARHGARDPGGADHAAVRAAGAARDQPRGAAAQRHPRLARADDPRPRRQPTGTGRHVDRRSPGGRPHRLRAGPRSRRPARSAAASLTHVAAATRRHSAHAAPRPTRSSHSHDRWR